MNNLRNCESGLAFLPGGSTTSLKRKFEHDEQTSFRKSKKTKTATKEKSRLGVFNQALEALQNIIPVRLPKGRKLHKKQTLEFALKYIKFLHECRESKKDFDDRYRFMYSSGSEEEDFINAIDAAACRPLFDTFASTDFDSLCNSTDISAKATNQNFNSNCNSEEAIGTSNFLFTDSNFKVFDGPCELELVDSDLLFNEAMNVIPEHPDPTAESLFSISFNQENVDLPILHVDFVDGILNEFSVASDQIALIQQTPTKEKNPNDSAYGSECSSIFSPSFCSKL
uniref:uncharacterized protein LOC120336513 n=1 Tax=Styela clava TaxID=7725 RepID=UPI0019393D5D|nr:uncharacterized protein LOC120336513 [Styela clava]